MEICNGRREVHIERLRDEGDPRCSAERPDDDYYMIFDEDDVRTMINSWRNDTQSYMKADTLRLLDIMTPQKVHQKKKSVHNSYMFQLSGDKWLLHQFLRVPMFCDTTQTPTHSAERPVWKVIAYQFLRTQKQRRLPQGSRRLAT